MFKNLLNSTNLIWVNVCLSLLLIGCQATGDQGVESVVPTEMIANEQNVALLNTMTPTSISSSTWTPTPVATNSPTPQSTQTPLPTQTATPTPWPTLPPDEAADKVLALLADNQNPDCLLPCWWGIMPRQTYWQDIKPFLNSFAIKIDETNVGASVKLPIPEPVGVSGFGYYVSFSWDESKLIREISVTSMNITGYDPQTMMSIYGPPDEVWLRTYDGLLPGDVLPFQLIVVYQQQGISFRYYINASIDSEIVTACFESGVVEEERPDLFPAGPRIYLWESGEHKTIAEIANIPWEIYLPLEDTTDLTPQTFYEKFTNPEKQPCIDTPAHFWGF